jgi:hypothetical protein
MKKNLLLLLTIIATIAIQTKSFSQVVADAGNDTIICAGMAVQIGGNPTASGGTLGYTYNWSPATGLSSTSIPNPMASPSGSTVYYVTVTDGSAATSTSSIIISVTPNPNVTVNSPTICAGGPAILTASGALTYSWSTGNMTNPITVNPLVTTAYTVTGTSSGCIGTAVIIVSVNPNPIVTVNSPTICGGTTATLIGNGATSYIWSNGATINPITVTPITTTTYTVTGTSLGCTATNSCIVTVNLNPVATASSNSPVCEGQTLNLFSTPNYANSYTWIGPNGFSSTLQNPSVTISQVSMNGIWTVYANMNGCADTATTIVTVNTNPVVTVSPNPAIVCAGSSSSINATIFSGNPPFNYYWSNGMTGSPITINYSSTYNLTVTDANGCSGTGFTTLIVDSALQISATTVNPTCLSCTDGSISITTISNGSGPFTFEWSNNVQLASTISNLAIGNYSVTVTSMEGCSAVNHFTLGVGNCGANFSLVPDTLTPHLYNATNLSFGTPPISYLWEWGDGTSDTTIAPIHNYNTEGFYNICLSITDGTGCTSSYCDSTFLWKTPNTMVEIVVIDETTVGVQELEPNLTLNLFPNPFSSSSTLRLSTSIQNGKLSIYDVLGKEVKQIKNLNGKEIIIQKENLKTGIYFFRIEDENGFVGNGKMVVK